MHGVPSTEKRDDGAFPKTTAPRTRLRAMLLAALFAAAAVLLSPFSFPVGPSRCFPFQHTLNVVAGVLLGPWWAVGSAFAASFVRYTTGMGTILAFPGSLFGALAVGLASRTILRGQRIRAWSALAEPCATGTLGALVAALIVSPEAVGGMFATLSVAFLISSVPGAALGLLVLKGLERRLTGSVE